MVKKHLFCLVISGLFLLPTLACGSTLTIDDPRATQTALQSTVTALEATVTNLETTDNIVQTQPSPTPNVIVVTATPVGTFTPIPSPTPLPTNTPSPTSTTPPTTSTQNQTIVIVITPTPSPSPTPKFYDTAPIIISPREGVVVEQGRQHLLHWSWNGLLGPNERFDIKIRPDGQPRSAYVAWEEGTSHDWAANLGPGRYFWSVQVIQGYYKNDSGHPDDRVLEAFLSPESEPRLIIVSEKSRSHPRSRSQADAPTPKMPYGLAAGGIAFVAFVGLIRTRAFLGS